MQKAPPTVLVVDREGEAMQALVEFLRSRGLGVVAVHDGASALAAIDRAAVDLLVTELQAPTLDGMKVLERACLRNPEVCAVVISESAGIEAVVESMRRGAADFQTKPVHLEKLLAVLQRGLERQALAARVAEMEVQLDERFGFGTLVGRSQALRRALDQARHVAPARGPVLMEGEAGTGRGLLAQAIHRNGPRKGGPFVWMSCTALAESAIESELFGSEPPAGEGGPGEPRAAVPGCYEQADGGTLYLEEVDLLPPSAQIRLLRALQDRTFERVGGTAGLKADVRLIAATRRDLGSDVRAGGFRADLLERLSVVRIQIPPLRERREDIPLLVEAFVSAFNRKHGRKVTGITRGALDRLLRYWWPGNVHELETTIESMVVCAQGRRALDLSDLPDPLRAVEDAGERLQLAVGMTVEEAERTLVAATLRHTAFDKPRAAEMLGMGLRTLYRKIKRYGLQ
ncbi:MAG TPA: sigma-54 dependent transcriptional regulator [Candidatus Eisenbacteria bacterium]